MRPALEMRPSAERLIEAYIKLSRDGAIPTYQEMANQLGISRQAVHTTIEYLRGKGIAAPRSGKHRDFRLNNI